MRPVWLIVFLALVLPVLAVPAHAQIRSIEDFAKHDETGRLRLDYAVWDYFLQQNVFYNGRSDRRPGKDATVVTGSRMKLGHGGRYSNEGNRVMFSIMRDETIDGLTAYREDLERVSGEIDFTRLPRREQLAYWLNLHNAALIERLARSYPLTRLQNRHRELFETKDLTVAGIPLSLNDIRLRIVYPNWRDQPHVMYGFWMGTIGGPSIQVDAFTSENLTRLLSENAVEFVNALRGVDYVDESGALRVSELYEEARPYFFDDWPNDLAAHLRQFAGDEVAALLPDGRQLRPDVYDWSIADLVNGQMSSSRRILSIGPDGIPREGGARIPPQGMDFIRRSLERQRRMARERKGIVIIIDLEPAEEE